MCGVRGAPSATLAFVAEGSEGEGALSPDVWEKWSPKVCAGGLEQSEQGKEGGWEKTQGGEQRKEGPGASCSSDEIWDFQQRSSTI